MPEDITLVCHLSKCTTFFWHCVTVDVLITIDLLEKWKQSGHRCLIQNVSLVTCCSLFQREKAHRQQVYPNLHFKINLKNNCTFHFHPIFNSNRFCAGNPTQTIILLSGYLPDRAECINLQRVKESLEIIKFLFHLSLFCWILRCIIILQTPQNEKKYYKRQNYIS